MPNSSPYAVFPFAGTPSSHADYKHVGGTGQFFLDQAYSSSGDYCCVHVYIRYSDLRFYIYIHIYTYMYVYVYVYVYVGFLTQFYGAAIPSRSVGYQKRLMGLGGEEASSFHVDRGQNCPNHGANGPFEAISACTPPLRP